MFLFWIFQILLNLLLFLFCLPLIKFSPGEKGESRWMDEVTQDDVHKTASKKAVGKVLTELLRDSCAKPLRLQHWAVGQIGTDGASPPPVCNFPFCR